MHRGHEKSGFPRKEKVLVAMSGGVDSSVAAALLLRDGYEVVGVTMRHFCFREGEASAGGQSCCSLESLNDARKVCEHLGISHFVIDAESDFRRFVIDDFTNNYLSGRTPNPCIRCNQYIRFPGLLNLGRSLGADRIATGHYARAGHDRGPDGPFMLLRGVDRDKDQSYFLWTMDQATLSRTIFPLGGLTKREVRSLAREFGIPVSEKPDSQEICFIPSGDYRDFLERRGGRTPALEPGPIVMTDGIELGRHDGVAFFTVGQRRGLGISGGRPFYVTEIRPETRSLIVGVKEELLSREFTVDNPRWISGSPPSFPFSCRVQIRHRHPGELASIEGDGSPSLRIAFEVPQEAIAPGQSAVFFDGDRVLGGGIIREVSRSPVEPA